MTYYLRTRKVGTYIFHVKIKFLVTAKSDQYPDPRWLGFLDLVHKLRLKAGSGSALKPMRIHNTDKMHVILSAGDVVDCSRHLARVTDHPRLLLGYEVSIPSIPDECRSEPDPDLQTGGGSEFGS
jgi:hypothetical protein